MNSNFCQIQGYSEGFRKMIEKALNRISKVQNAKQQVHLLNKNINSTFSYSLKNKRNNSSFTNKQTLVNISNTIELPNIKTMKLSKKKQNEQQMNFVKKCTFLDNQQIMKLVSKKRGNNINRKSFTKIVSSGITKRRPQNFTTFSSKYIQIRQKQGISPWGFANNQQV